MLSDIFRNRFVIASYIIGVITIILAIYVVIMPFSIHYYYNGTAINSTFRINPADTVFIILRTGNNSLNANFTVIKWIPETNITLTLYYTASLSPNQTETLNFTTITSLTTSIVGNGHVEIIGVHRSRIIDILTIVLTILFILVIALLIIGFTESIINIHGKA